MHSEFIVKMLSTHFLLSVHEQAAVSIDKIFLLLVLCLHQLEKMMVKRMSEYLLSQNLRQ